jgi:hypothetical protein
MTSFHALSAMMLVAIGVELAHIVTALRRIAVALESK